MYKSIADIAFSEEAWWFIYRQGKILLLDGQFRVPFGSLGELPFPSLVEHTPIHIGEYQGSPCYLIESTDDVDFGLGEFCSLRNVLGVSEDLFMMAGRAWQLANFLDTHKYCGRCNSEMSRVDWELATHCDNCHHRCYPRISPCIIVAIRKENQILLARSKRHAEGVFSILAGFVEAGETLEQAVHREVFEEVALKIKNLQYVGSQPWPFPHSLMMGYTAEYKSGDIIMEEKEIVEAGWFSFDNLPTIPPKASIAGKLIDLTKSHCKA